MHVRLHVPYELSFTRKVEIADPDAYYNECCQGGDRVLEQLLPVLEEAYDGIESNQEDWGWFAWFSVEGIGLAVDIFTDEPSRGEFRIHLTSSIRRFLLGPKVEDTPELESLRALICKTLEAWPVADLKVMQLDEKHTPVSNAI